MNNTMTRRIFRSTLLVGVVVLLAALALVMGVLYSYFGRVQESQLRDELSLAAVGVTQSGEDYLRQLKSDQYRITWVAADGSVLYDTQADASAMENHAQRQEVRQALAYGEGESSRYSSTLLQKTVYYAKLLPDGTVLRLSSVRVTAGVLMLNMLQPLLLLVIAVLILSGVLAGRLAKRITEPLNRLDLENPLENDTYEELAPLLRRMEHQRRQIDLQMDELKQRAEEFQQITGSMNEGLVLLDENGAILSINPAAQRLLGTDNACVGQDILTVDRDVSLSDGLRTAAQEGHSEFRGRRGGREYQFDISRIQTEGRTAGTVLLVFDVTERAFAEQNRQRVPRAENALAGYHRQRGAAGKRHGEAGGRAPLCGTYPLRGPASGDADRRHHPPVPAGRGRAHANGDRGPAGGDAGGCGESPDCGGGP